MYAFIYDITFTADDIISITYLTPLFCLHNTVDIQFWHGRVSHLVLTDFR